MTFSPDPIQAQLIAARRNQILDAAAKVFSEKGFHPTTIKDIATEAGIAHGTIYNYFDNKTALLLGIFERMKTSIIQENILPAPTEIDFHTFLYTSLHHPLMALKKDNFALFRIVISEMMVNEELRTLYFKQILEPTLMIAETYFQELAAKRGLSPTETRLTIRAISGMVLGLILENIMGDGTLSEQWEELPNFLTDLIFNGLKGNE